MKIKILRIYFNFNKTLLGATSGPLLGANFCDPAVVYLFTAPKTSLTSYFIFNKVLNMLTCFYYTKNIYLIIKNYLKSTVEILLVCGTKQWFIVRKKIWNNFSIITQHCGKQYHVFPTKYFRVKIRNQTTY